MITAALLLAAIATPQSQSLLLNTEPVFVEVMNGRGSLLAGDITKPLSSHDGEQWVEGRGHISLVAGSKAELRWHRRASIVLYGPCDFEWQPASPRESLKWSFNELQHASIEIRQSEAEIQLGENWSAFIPACALELKRLSGYGYEVLQKAGEVASYQWSSTSTLARPELLGVIGSPVRLKRRPLASRDDLSRQLEGRSSWSWPWRKESETSSSWKRSDWPWIAARPSPTKILISPKLQAPKGEPMTPSVISVELPAAETPEANEAPAVIKAELPTAAEPTETPEEPKGTELEGGDGTWGLQQDVDSEDTWRGTDQTGYERFGEYYVQKGAGIDAWQLPDGSVRFTIPEGHTGGGWVLGPRLDARINPGGSIEYQPNRALKNHSGEVRVLAAIER